MNTLYARLEKTPDETLRRYAPIAAERNAKRHRDAVFYRDAEMTQVIARWPWYRRNRPTSRKRVTLNCNVYNVEWVA